MLLLLILSLKLSLYSSSDEFTSDFIFLMLHALRLPKIFIYFSTLSQFSVASFRFISIVCELFSNLDFLPFSFDADLMRNDFYINNFGSLWLILLFMIDLFFIIHLYIVNFKFLLSSLSLQIKELLKFLYIQWSWSLVFWKIICSPLLFIKFLFSCFWFFCFQFLFKFLIEFGNLCLSFILGLDTIFMCFNFSLLALKSCPANQLYMVSKSPNKSIIFADLI